MNNSITVYLPTEKNYSEDGIYQVGRDFSEEGFIEHEIVEEKKGYFIEDSKSDNLPNLHLIELKFFGATDKLPRRVRLRSMWFTDNKDQWVTDDSKSHKRIDQQIVDKLEANGYRIIGSTTTTKATVLISTIFKPILLK